MAFSASAVASAIWPDLLQGLGLGDLVSGIAGLEADRLGRRTHGLVVLAQRGQGPAPQPLGPGIARLKLDRLLGVVQAEFGADVDVRFGPEHEGFGRDRLQNDMRDFLERLARVGGRLKGEEHSALRIRLPEDLAQLVGNQYRLDLREFQLLGDLGGRETVFEADDQRGDLVVARIGHLDARERIDRVQLHQAGVEFSRFLGLSPGLFHVVTGACAGGDAVETGDLDLGRSEILRVRHGDQRRTAVGDPRASAAVGRGHVSAAAARSLAGGGGGSEADSGGSEARWAEPAVAAPGLALARPPAASRLRPAARHCHRQSGPGWAGDCPGGPSVVGRTLADVRG